MAFTFKRSLLSLTVVAGLVLGACSSAPSASMAAPAADSAVGQLVESTPFYVSHRLAGKQYPEMTTRGMQASIDAGFTAFEYSVYRTKDGVFVGSHEWTTQRLTGVRKEIWNTDWADLKDMQLPGGTFSRIEDIVGMMPSDGVLVLDHKPTSTKAQSNVADMTSEEELFELLDSLFENPQERVIWKVFKDASSAERARDRGYSVMGMLYRNEIASADFDRFDIIGMEHSAPQSAWDIVNSQGKPTIAQIVSTAAQEARAFARGADGIMSTDPRESAPNLNSSPVSRLLSSSPFYVSHRLGGEAYPEMTTRGMQASIDAGFKAFEYSVFRTKDGIYVGSHDWTTERLTGIRKEIWNTNWADLKDMDLAGGKFTRIEDIVEMMPSDGVLVLDHKTTSTKVHSHTADMASEEELFELLDSLFENPQERVIWKVFKDASSAERARERGYKTMGLLYSDQLQGVDFSRRDIIGLEHNAPQSAWDVVNSQGKPTIAHIVANRGQESRAFNYGADGIMSTQPYEVSPSRYEAQ